MLNSKIYKFNNIFKNLNKVNFKNQINNNNNNNSYLIRNFCNIVDKNDKENDDFNLDGFVKNIEKDIEKKEGVIIKDAEFSEKKDNELNSTELDNDNSNGNNNNSNNNQTTTTTTSKKGRPKGSKSKSKLTTPTTSTTPTTPTTNKKSPKLNSNNNLKESNKFNDKNISNKVFQQIIKDYPFIEPYVKDIISMEKSKKNNDEDNNDIHPINIPPTLPPTAISGATVSIHDLDNILNQFFKKPLPQSQTLNETKIKNNLSEEQILGEDNLLPKQIVSSLNEYIIGQAEAKRAVSIALRNRWRRKRLDSSMKGDVFPKNILMIGPTGVGKTEIARRIASIVNAPFIKVEATKYTEVGYHGPDVDSIIKDLVDVSIANIKSKIAESHKSSIEADVEREIINGIVGPNGASDELLKLYRQKSLDHVIIEIDVPNSYDKQHLPSQSPLNLDDESPFIKLLVPSSGGGIGDKGTKKRRVTIAEAKVILDKVYRDKYTVSQDVTKLAVQSAEQNGIVFIDEIDKICTSRDAFKNGGDASSDGVQRDLLPIIEGCNVNTKYGMVDTSRILFIASGAFHTSKPSDLISELQGRLPIRVELKPLDENDFYRILTEPKNNQILQQKALMKTEDIDLQFSEDALREVSKIAFEANAQVQNLGARRLHGIIERIIEDISFNCDVHKGKTVNINVEDVRKTLSDLLLKTDLSKYII